MNFFKLAMSATLAAGLITACGDDDTTTDTGTPPADAGTTPTDMGTTPADMGTTPDMGTTEDMGTTGFTPPANTVPVNFTIDDSANRSYTPADGLAWKGSFDYDADTRLLSLDTGWSPPYPLVYDDGPWDQGGHEPAGAMAGDGIWGITAFVEIPTEAPVNFEYGAIKDSDNGSDGNWIWNQPSNGTFTVDVGASAPVETVGLVIAPWGTIDFRVTLDSAQMNADFAANFDPSMHMIEIKSSQWGWSLIEMTDDGMNGDVTAGDGIYTFQLLPNVGSGTPRPHSGGLNSGDEAQFVLQVRGVEYKGMVDGIMGSAPLVEGVRAEISTDDGATWTEVTIGRAGNDNNTTVAAP